MSQQNLRNEFLDTLTHVGNVLTTVTQNTGPAGFLAETDLHLLAEGLFLSAWTHWEQFTHYVLVEDLATSVTSKLHCEIQQFRTADAPWRLANQLLNHPDHPQRFIEWSDYAVIVSRANEFLGAGNRFSATPLPRRGDLDLLKRVRNAVAHRSDAAWDSFLRLCQGKPFSIPAPAMTNITPGSFLVAHNWNGQPVLRDTISLLDAAARHLVL
ncbi:MAG: hypothetical protein HY298_20385 [Verrucomicrobia bacterium]|nr:hypothetical protein [Verrucomicrobiota bacterium]